MDSQIVQQVIQWVQQNVGDTTTKQELTQKAEGSNLPQEGKQLFQQLPEGSHSKEGVIQALQEKAMAGFSGGGGGGLGGMMGG